MAPNGAVAKVSDFFSGTDSDSYSIPTGSDQFAQVGTWIAEVVDTNGVSLAEALFVVKDPAHNNVDLSIGKFGPFQVSAEPAGSNGGRTIATTKVVVVAGETKHVVLTDDTSAAAQ